MYDYRSGTAHFIAKGLRMFGYVTPRKQELKVKDFNLYRTVYCSLCKTLKNRYGRISTLFLNYDFTFLSLVGLALINETPQTSEGRCVANPLRKQTFLESEALDYSADCLVMTTFHKLSDDLRDEGLVKQTFAFVARIFLSAAYKKAKRTLKDIGDVIAENMQRQRSLESSGESGLDAASDPTAHSLAHIFEMFATTGDEKRILSRMGYLLGRFVYLADAGDDLREDVAKKRYNPLVQKNATVSPDDADFSALISEIKEQLLLVRGEIAVCYNLLTLKRYRSVLDNIVFFGLEDAVAAIGQKDKRLQSAELNSL